MSSLSKRKEIPGFKANKAVIENVFSTTEFEWRMTPPKEERNTLQVDGESVREEESHCALAIV